jgi:hypothetical protein
VQIASVNSTISQFDEISSFHCCVSVRTGAISTESFKMTKSLEMSPVQKGFLASDPDIIPS